jgi:hypothetical protein
MADVSSFRVWRGFGLLVLVIPEVGFVLIRYIIENFTFHVFCVSVRHVESVTREHKQFAQDRPRGLLMGCYGVSGYTHARYQVNP